MRMSQAFAPTLRTVGEATMASHRLLLQAGYIRPLAAGVYAYLPLATRVLQQVMQIIREEMDRVGGQEVGLPVLCPASLWEETGRYDAYGPELMRLKDRHDRPFVLGPTHEEVITSLLRDAVSSYKKLPLLLYQIQTKLRDEVRPRSGLLRGREFWMKDAYSFHADMDSLLVTYQDVLLAYQRIFDRCQLRSRMVQADAGAIGGEQTHEFLVISPIGEDSMVVCPACSYAANIELAQVAASSIAEHGTVPPLEFVPTPDCRSITEVAAFFKVSSQQVVKSLVLLMDDQPCLVLLRGDRTINLTKVQRLTKAQKGQLADNATVQAVMGSEPGFIGPLHRVQQGQTQCRPTDIPLILDQEVAAMPEWIIGGNERDVHIRHVQWGRDLTSVDGKYQVADVRMAEQGDGCPHCGQELSWERGIEVGHIFQLETRYSKPMAATFLTAEGNELPFVMGCYGIGVSRLMAAAVEQHHDKAGICWPTSLAPYQIHLLVVNPKQEEQLTCAERIYTLLQENNLETLYDDRWERPGVKFHDADLLGIPLQIIVGKKAGESQIECKVRRTGERGQFPVSELLPQLKVWQAKVEKAQQGEQTK